jgi:hypothetical protein
MVGHRWIRGATLVGLMAALGGCGEDSSSVASGAELDQAAVEATTVVAANRGDLSCPGGAVVSILGSLGEAPADPPSTPGDAIADFAGYGGLPRSLREPLQAAAEDGRAVVETENGQDLQFETAPAEGRNFALLDGERAVSISVRAWDTGGFIVTGLTFCGELFPNSPAETDDGG